jgi:hypothetical protein
VFGQRGNGVHDGRFYAFNCPACAPEYRACMTNNTFVNHPPEVEVPADNRPLVAPIYQSVKFSFDDTGETLRYLRGEREGFFYSRNSQSHLAATAADCSRSCREGMTVCWWGPASPRCRKPAVPVQTGRSRARVRRILRSDALHRAASSGPKFGVTHTLLSIEDLAASSGCCARRRPGW